MNQNETSGKEVGESVDEKRAQYERMAFTVCRNGVVNVRNDSYGDDSGAHIYSVEVADGEATGCSCPHATHRGAHCKHQIAVEENPIVVSSASAASATPKVATDGGTDDEPDMTYHRERPEVGGALYARCEECGAESVVDHRGDTGILHDSQCSHATPAVDPYPDEPEVDETPL